ncbi:MAG: flagellar export chaperone FliS [bacterium]
MYNNMGLQRYREADFSSMTQEKMIVLLYEKTVSDLQEAVAAADDGGRLEMTRKLNHAMRIITELRAALDHSIGGDIARNLDSIYDFIFHECLQMIADQESRHARSAIEVLEPLLDAWRRIPAGTGQKAARDRIQSSADAQGGPETASGPGGNRSANGTHSTKPVEKEPAHSNQGILSVSA